MAKNLYEDMARLLQEISHLQSIQSEIDAFNRARKTHPNVIPISPQKYSELLRYERLDDNTFYYVFKEETGQYIDGYVV